MTDAVFRKSTYDANGNRKALDLEQVQGTTSTALRHTAFAFDPLNRLEDVTQDDGSPSGVLTGYAYDVQDNLQTLTDGKSHDTDYGTDDFGRQVEVVSADTGTTRFEYDEAGNLLEKNQNGLVTQYAYDALNRLTTVTFPSGTSQNVTYTYDARADGPTLPPADGDNWVGRLAKMTDASATTYFSYDKRGNVTLEERQQGAATLTIIYAWDENGNLEAITYPSGRKVTYSYYGAANDQPILMGMMHQGQNLALATGITFEPFGPLAFLRYGNGLKETRTYDDAGQIDGLTVAPDVGTPVLSLDYSFDETGNITRIDDQLDALKSKIYEPEGYDKLDRLIKATIGGLGTFQYTYDAVGNRTEEDHDGAVTTYTLQTTNNQIDTLSGATTATFGYDAHGNMTTDGTLTFAYHPTHQLKEATDQTPTVLGSYQYDGQSRRTAKTVSGLTRLFAYDTGAQMLGEYDDGGEVLKEYAYLGTQRLVMVDHDRDDEGIRDEVDNCSVVQNPDQADGDSDLLGNVCDAAAGNPDGDGDGLLDGEEDADKDGQVSAGETDPDNPDTDGDTFSDGDEVTAGTDPLNPNSYPGAPSAVPALSVMGAVTFLVLFTVGRFWTLRRRWSKVGRGMDLMVLALGLTLMAPQAVTPQGGGAAERVLYIHTDHLGTAQKLTDAAQQVVWEVQAEAFGKTTVTAQSTVFNLRFPGQYEDRETGLFYNYLRTHNPATGQYLQPDPLGVVTGANVYGYVDGNPLRRVDPTGELFTPDTALDGAFIVYDVYRLLADNLIGSCDNLGTNLSALGADSLAFVIPAVTGAGLGVRAAARAAEAGLKANKAATAARRAEQAADIGSLTKGAGPTTSMTAARGAIEGPVEFTRAGERFVRVGAEPRNLNFTFETPGGVRAKTFAFPEETFNEIGNNPLKLKDLGDLPGQPPTVSRLLEPPPGTPIQRGIVPGGQNGGTGGVPEVFFPEGF